MWNAQITELWQINEQEQMLRRSEAAARRYEARLAGARARHVPSFPRIRRDRRDGS